MDARAGRLGFAVVVATTGLGLVLVGDRLLGPALALAGNAYLLWRAFRFSQRGASRLHRALASPLALLGGILFAAGTLTLDVFGGPADRTRGMMMGVMGAQALLAAFAIPTGARGLGRLLVPTLGHALAFYGSLRLIARPDAVVEIAYVGGISLLLLHVQWTYAADPARRERVVGWERYLLLVVGVAAVLAVANPYVLLNSFAVTSGRATELISRAALAFAVVVIADPPSVPAWLRSRPGGARQFLAQGIATMLLLNALLLGVLLVAPGIVPFAWWAFTAWLVVAVGFEYAALAHHVAVRSRQEAPPPSPVPPLTVVVAAFDERDVLASTMRHNLALPLPLRFLIVAAQKSKDGTVQLAQALAAEHPSRVMCVVGQTGSKAGDLTAAWPAVTTPLALILDADETISAAAIERGVALMRAHPEVDILQGRKSPREPEATRVARFAASERRFSTLLDHRVQSDRFGAAHFAGSAALLRRDVPMRVGGWSSSTLTEDIEFTMRLHLAGGTRIVYDPSIHVDESNPDSFRDLVRQRARWARGWGQVYWLHFRALLTSRSVPLRRKVGLAWQLQTSVSAPWSIFLPTIVVLWLMGRAPVLPPAVALALALYILPSRGIVFAYAALADGRDAARRPWHLLRAAAHGYGWIVMGWLLQLHAFMLEVSAAPRAWYGTVKTVEVAEPAGEGRPLPPIR